MDEALEFAGRARAHRDAWAHAAAPIERLRAAGHEAWLVGGLVRDLWADRPGATWTWPPMRAPTRS